MQMRLIGQGSINCIRNQANRAQQQQNEELIQGSNFGSCEGGPSLLLLCFRVAAMPQGEETTKRKLKRLLVKKASLQARMADLDLKIAAVKRLRRQELQERAQSSSSSSSSGSASARSSSPSPRPSCPTPAESRSERGAGPGVTCPACLRRAAKLPGGGRHVRDEGCLKRGVVETRGRKARGAESGLPRLAGAKFGPGSVVAPRGRGPVGPGS